MAHGPGIIRAMRTPWAVVVILGFLAACAGQSSIRPAEVLDERTGVTVGALQGPIEFVENMQGGLFLNGKRPSFAYLGPVEWDRMGDISYALWIHVAPANGNPVGDIRAPGAVTLKLDEGALVLSPLAAPDAAQGPYKPVVSWGQTGYFKLDVETLKRMAASRKLEIHCRAADDSTIEFLSSHETHATLTQYLHSRGITDD